MSLKKTRGLLYFTLILLLASCSGNPPVLAEIWWQPLVEVDPSNGQVVQTLSLFVHGSDEDGEEDLETLYLIYDDLELYWTIPAESWTEYTDQGTKWIGVNGLRAPGEGILPQGDYRILLNDIGGERDEKSFYLRNSIPPSEEMALPEIEFNSSNLTVNSEYPLFQVWFYNQEGGLVEKSQSYQAGRYLWNDISRNITRRAVSFSLYTEPDTGAWGMLIGPYFFSD